MRAIIFILLVCVSVISKGQDASYSHIFGSASNTINVQTGSYLPTDTDYSIIFNLSTGASSNCIMPDPRLFKGRVINIKRSIPSTSQVFIISPAGAASDTIMCISEGMTVPHFNSSYSGLTIVHNVELQSTGTAWEVLNYR